MSWASLPQTSLVTQALSDLIRLGLIINPLQISLPCQSDGQVSPFQPPSSDQLHQTSLLRPPSSEKRGEDYNPVLLAPRALALHPQGGATLEGSVSTCPCSVALGIVNTGNSKHKDTHTGAGPRAGFGASILFFTCEDKLS